MLPDLNFELIMAEGAIRSTVVRVYIEKYFFCMADPKVLSAPWIEYKLDVFPSRYRLRNVSLFIDWHLFGFVCVFCVSVVLPSKNLNTKKKYSPVALRLLRALNIHLFSHSILDLRWIFRRCLKFCTTIPIGSGTRSRNSCRVMGQLHFTNFLSACP